MGPSPAPVLDCEHVHVAKEGGWGRWGEGKMLRWKELGEKKWAAFPSNKKVFSLSDPQFSHL